MPSDAKDPDLESWLEGLGEKEKRRGQEAKLSETRTVRFSPAMADRLDRLADKRGVSFPALVRSMCAENQPPLEAAEATINQLYEIIDQLVDVQESSESKKARELHRQAQKIYNQHQGNR